MQARPLARLRSILGTTLRARLLLALTAAIVSLARAQTPAVKEQAAPRTFADSVRDLPDLAGSRDRKASDAFAAALLSSTEPERLAAVPDLMRWTEDPRPEVRESALATVALIYYAFPPANGFAHRSSLPLQDIEPVAAHLLDTVGAVRPKAALALVSANYTSGGQAELNRLLLPLLRNPDIFTRFPDPFFVESDAFILSKSPPERQEAMRKMQAQHPVILLPAAASAIFGLLISSPVSTSPATDDALIAFLNSPNQTPDTLSDCLHDLALAHASEAVTNEALTRVFAKKAMSVFLLQFLSTLRLTPEDLVTQKAHLLALSTDETTAPPLRHAAATVAACWNGDTHTSCAPTQQDFHDANNPPRPPQ